TSNWTNLSGGPVSAGFYTGEIGASGVAVGNPWSLSGGSTGTITGNVTLTQNEETQLLSGKVYYTYATVNHPSGEVRGQISVTR
ncbi:MAG: CHRD domain-containing protein, partial [Bacteroidota bacterium]